MKAIAWIIVLACLLTATTNAQPAGSAQGKDDVDPWASAEAALAEHIAPLVKRLRSKCDDPRARYVEFRSAVFDRTYIPHLGAIDYALPYWAYSASEKNGGWTVNIRFIGPPEVSIVVPPSYEIDVDDKQAFRDIRIRQ